jgi:RHS repeat-associated protein
MRTTIRPENASRRVSFPSQLKSVSDLLIGGACLAALLAGCHGPTPGDQSSTAPDSKMQESAAAKDVVERLHSRFVMKPHDSLKRRFGLTGPLRVLGSPEMDKAELADSAVSPHFPNGNEVAMVKYPIAANAPFALTDAKSGATLTAALDSAASSRAESAKGYIVYRNALPDADVIHRPSQYGTEDAIVFEKPPAQASVTYSVALPASVAGLRLFSNVLEFLDKDGTPLFHIAPPYLVDSLSHVTRAALSVTGCRVDTSDQPSWHRTPTAPGATSCTVAISWDGDKVSYPAVLDPSWTTGATMSIARSSFASAVITSGSPSIVAAGGYSAFDSNGFTTDVIASDFFDVASGTWSLGPSLSQAVEGAVAVYNSSTNEVLVTGGSTCSGDSQTFSCTNYATTQLLSKNPTTGAWSWATSAPMRVGRSSHTATLLARGQVLLAGGYDNTTADWTHVTAQCDLYDFATHQLVTQPPPDMHQARAQHAATFLSSGPAVLVTGGLLLAAPSTWIDPPTAEIYLAATNQWVSAPDSPTPHTNSASVALSGNSVILVGGADYQGFQNEADIFTFSATAPYGAWSSAGNFATVGRGFAPAALLSNGAVLVASGWAGTRPYGAGWEQGVLSTEADLYDPIGGKWIQTASESAVHFNGAAQSVPYQGSTTTVVFGGTSGANGAPTLFTNETITNVSEIFTLTPTGQPCTSNSECAGGYCVTGTCCTNSTCSGEVGGYRIDARALTQNTFILEGYSTPFSTRTVQTINLAPGTHSILIPGLPATEHIDFKINAMGAFDYDPSLSGVLIGRNTHYLQVKGRTITVDARTLSQSSIALSTLDPATQLINTATRTQLTLLPAHGYGFTNGNGLPVNFAFDLDVTGKVHIASSYAKIAAGDRSSTLVLTGAPVNITANVSNTSMGFASLYGNGITIPANASNSLHLMPLQSAALYNFVVGTGEVTTFGFNVDLSGNFQYATTFDGYVAGRGTPSLAINPTMIEIDASPDTPGRIQLAGTTGIGSLDSRLVQRFRLMPVVGGYKFEDSSGTFTFTLKEDGTIDYDTSLDGEFSGRGTGYLIDAAESCVGFTPAQIASAQLVNGWQLPPMTCLGSSPTTVSPAPALTINRTRPATTGTAPATTPKPALAGRAAGSGGRAPGVAGGDPVLLDGEFFIQRTDVQLAGIGLHYEFKRTYRSQVDFDGPLGSSWDHNYDKLLVIDPAYNTFGPLDGAIYPGQHGNCYQNDQMESVDYYDGELNVVHFKASSAQCSDSKCAVVYSAPPGTFLSLEKEVSGAWKMTDADGNVLLFDAPGTLQSITDLAGNKMTFKWTAIDISDMYSGIQTSFYRLNTVTDVGNRTVTYAYDDPGVKGKLKCITLGSDCTANTNLLASFSYVSSDYLSAVFPGQATKAEHYTYSSSATPTLPEGDASQGMLPSDCFANPAIVASCNRLCGGLDTSDPDSCFNTNDAAALGPFCQGKAHFTTCNYVVGAPPTQNSANCYFNPAGYDLANVGPCMAASAQIPWSSLFPNGYPLWDGTSEFTMADGQKKGFNVDCWKGCQERHQCWGYFKDGNQQKWLPFWTAGGWNDLKNNITDVTDENGNRVVHNDYSSDISNVYYDRVNTQVLGPTTDLPNTIYFDYHDLDIEANGLEVYTLRNNNYDASGNLLAKPKPGDPYHYVQGDGENFVSVWYFSPSVADPDHVLSMARLATVRYDVCPALGTSTTSPQYQTYDVPKTSTTQPVPTRALVIEDLHGVTRTKYLDANYNLVREDIFAPTETQEPTLINYDSNNQVVGISAPSGMRTCYQRDPSGHVTQTTTIPASTDSSGAPLNGDSTPLVDVYGYDPKEQAIDIYTDVAHGPMAMAHTHLVRDTQERITEMDQSGGPSIPASSPLVTTYDYKEIGSDTPVGIRETPATVTLPDRSTTNQYRQIDPSMGGPTSVILNAAAPAAQQRSFTFSYDQFGRKVQGGETGGYAQQFVFDPITTKLQQINHRYDDATTWIQDPMTYHLSDEQVRVDSVQEGNPNNGGRSRTYSYAGGALYPISMTLAAVGPKGTGEPGLPKPQTSCFHYSGDGQLQTVILPEGNEIDYSYDSDGRVLSIEQGYGYHGTPPPAWSADCPPVTPPSGDNGLFKEEFYTYDNEGFLTSFTKDDLKYTVKTDGFGQVIEVKNASTNTNEAVRELGYDGAGRLIWQASVTAATQIQPGQKPTTTTPGLLEMTEYSYDILGRTISSVKWLVQEQEWANSSIIYDDKNRQVTQTDQVVPWSGNSSDPGRTTIRTFDGLGRVVQETLPKPYTATTGIMHSVSAGIHQAVVTQQTNQGTLTRTFVSDTRGNLHNVLDENNNVLSSESHDDDNQPLVSMQTGTGAGGTTTRKWDRFGRLVHVDQDLLNGTTVPTDFVWDRNDRRTGYVDGAGGQWSTTFGGDDQPLLLTGPGNYSKTYLYEVTAPQHVVGISESNGRKTCYHYDYQGLPAFVYSSLCPAGTSPFGPAPTPLNLPLNSFTSHTPLGQDDTITAYKDPTRPADATAAFTYDSLGRVIDQTITSNDSNVPSYVVHHDFLDQAQSLKTTLTMTGPSVPLPVWFEHHYDSVGRLATVSLNGNNLATYNWGTVGAGGLVSLSYTNGATATYGYDGKLRQTAVDIAFKVPGQNQSSFVASFHEAFGADSVPRMRQRQIGTGAQLTDVFQVDGDNRVIGESLQVPGLTLPQQEIDNNFPAVNSNIGTGNAWRGYGLDNLGNWTTVTTSSGTVTDGVDSLSRLTAIGSQSVSKDPTDDLQGLSGDPVQFAFDAFTGSVLTQSNGGVTTSYAYDALGRRALENGTGANVSVVWDGQVIIAHGDATNPTIDVPGDDPDAHIASVDQNGGADPRYYHQGPDQSVLAITNKSGLVEGYSYSAFGETTVWSPAGAVLPGSTVGTRFLFQGQLYDALTGTYSMRARQYQPKWGRFLSPDPLAFTAAPSLYSFTGSRPLTRRDPSGLADCDFGFCVDWGWGDSDSAPPLPPLLGNPVQGSAFIGLTDRNNNPYGALRPGTPQGATLPGSTTLVKGGASQGTPGSIGAGAPQTIKQGSGSPSTIQRFLSGFVAKTYPLDATIWLLNTVGATTSATILASAKDNGENSNDPVTQSARKLGTAYFLTSFFVQLFAGPVAEKGAEASAVAIEAEIAGGARAGQSAFNAAGGRSNCVNCVIAFLKSVKEGRLVTASGDIAENLGSIAKANKQIAEQLGGRISSFAQRNALATTRERQFFVVYPGNSETSATHVLIGINNRGATMLYDPQSGERFYNIMAKGNFFAFGISF